MIGGRQMSKKLFKVEELDNGWIVKTDDEKVAFTYNTAHIGNEYYDDQALQAKQKAACQMVNYLNAQFFNFDGQFALIEKLSLDDDGDLEPDDDDFDDNELFDGESQ